MIRVGIVDDHSVIAHGVASQLRSQPDMRVIAAARTPKVLIDSAEDLDVVLLDLSLGDGSSVAENVVTVSSLTHRVIAFTSGDQPHLIREATRAGIVGLVRKSSPINDLIQTIRAVCSESAVIDPEWATALEADRKFVSTLLTAREVEVLSHYASGLPAKRVAQLLYVSEDTVIDHIRRIRLKYSQQDRPATSKVDLFRRAVQDGIIPLDD